MCSVRGSPRIAAAPVHVAGMRGSRWLSQQSESAPSTSLGWNVSGVYSSGPFPLYAVGPYTQLSYPFTPSGQRTTTGCMNWGPGLVGVVTNAYAEIYRR